MAYSGWGYDPEMAAFWQELVEVYAPLAHGIPIRWRVGTKVHQAAAWRKEKGVWTVELSPLLFSRYPIFLARRYGLPMGLPPLHALVRVLEEARTLEVDEGLPGGAVLYRLPLPGPAPEGSEAWREVELEALLAEGGRLLEREAASAAEAQALAEEAKELALRLQAHPLGESDRALALLTVLEAFRKAMERLAARYEAWASDRVAREGTAYAAHLSFPQRLARLRYRDRTGE